MTNSAILLLLLLAVCVATHAFLSPVSQPRIRSVGRYPLAGRRDSSLHLFGDWFSKKGRDDDETKDSEDAHVAVEETAQSRADKLRAQAARIRLEAEKGRIELTLDKISKLDAQLNKIQAKAASNQTFAATDEKERLQLEEALAVLKSQLLTKDDGEIVAVVSPPVEPSLPTTKNDTTKMEERSSVPSNERLNTQDRSPDLPLTDEELQSLVTKFNQSPPFLQTMIAKIAGWTNLDDHPLNATEILTQLFRDEQQLDLQTAFMKTNVTDARAAIERAYAASKDMDTPSRQDIDNKVEELGNLPTFLKRWVTGSTNDTEIAIQLLRDGNENGLWYNNNKKKGSSRQKNDNFLPLFGNNQGETVDNDDEQQQGSMDLDDIGLLMESTFPASTRKEGETPTQKEVEVFVKDVLGPTKVFVPGGNPISVPGGWIIRGKNQCKNGDELMEQLDKRIANVAGIRDNVSFFLIKDPYPPSEDDFILDPLNWPQVLFVTGSDVSRVPRPIIGTLITAVGISTTWYASIYPFLTNTKLYDRAEEAMNLADAGMPVDLSWLSDESIPLFFAFVGLQLLHESAHIAVAKAKNFEVTVPTLIPSVISGITSSITSLKTPPKNKSDLLLFSVAGPLTGIMASLLLEVYGLALTASADVSSLQGFPGLPLALLRQSSLGGGLVDLVLGNGVLNVPSSIDGANMLASTVIPLHPFAIAGFVSLLVNALALVPAGRTDGGRISMSLFGRSGSQGLTIISLATLFIVGFLGSDLMLFYFGFLILAQLELEIPLRNEIDDVGLPGVLLASLAGFLAVLTLVPM